MKRCCVKIIVIALSAFMFFSCAHAGTDYETGSSVTWHGTGSPDETYPFSTNEGVTGRIEVSSNSDSINMSCSGANFSVMYSKGDTWSAPNGTRTLAKSGSSIITQKTAGKIVTEAKWKDASVTTEYIIFDDSVRYSQHAEAEGGLSAVGVTFRVSDACNVILPYQNGIRLSRKHPDLGAYVGSKENYQYGLQMQMFIIEGNGGGALVYCDDAFTQFKQLDVSHSAGVFTVTAESVPQAPFSERKIFDSAEWVIVPYVGDWTSASAIYRDFVTVKFGLEEADRFRPDWVDDIQLYFGTDMHDKNELTALASRVDASKVILQVPDWRTNLYDVNWPDYTPQPQLKEMIEFAHSLGYKVQLHCNMFGFQTELEDYSRFEKYHSRDCFTGKPIYQDFSDSVRHYRFASINPASKEWREYIIDKLVTVVRETGCDALHLDQSLISYNDANGYVDGMTSLQGTVAYLKELAEALPEGVAIGGEGITDFNATYSSFLQSHPYGIDSSGKKWFESCGDQIVPLTASVYTNVKISYWPGTPLTSNHDYYLAWYRFGGYAGEMPTIWRESASTLSSSDPVTSMILDEVNWFIENEPVRVYSGWTNDTVARYYLKNGTYARALRTSSGYVLLGNENDPESAVTQIVHGASEISSPLGVNDWIAHDSTSVFGLDPSGYHVLSKGAKFSDSIHISSLTADAFVTRFNDLDDMLQLTFESPKAENVTFTVKGSKKITSAVCNSRECEMKTDGSGYVTVTAPAGAAVYLLYEAGGGTLPVSLYSTAFTTYYETSSGSVTVSDSTKKGTGSFAGKLVKKITVSVPNRTNTSLEYAVSIPTGSSAVLTFGAGTADNLDPAVPLYVMINGSEVWRAEAKDANTRIEGVIDLSDYSGKTVMIKFCADGREIPGLTKKIVWIDPVISEK